MNVPRLYPIASSVQDVVALLRLGYIWIQYRNKTATFLDFKNLSDACKKNRIRPEQRVFLNDSIDACWDFEFDGVHLGQSDIPENLELLDRLKKAQRSIGISTHSHDELVTALALEPHYIAIGPLFASESKPTLQVNPLSTNFALAQLAANRSMRCIVGIGGIQKRNARTVLANGFTTLAFIKWTERILAEHVTQQQFWKSILWQPQNSASVEHP